MNSIIMEAIVLCLMVLLILHDSHPPHSKP